MPNSFKYHASLIVANILFGANYSFYSSLIGANLSSDSLYMLRTLSTALFFIPLMFIAGKAKIDLKDIRKIAVVTLLLIFGRQFLMIEAMNYTSPIDGSIIATSGPILIMIISAIMVHEKITPFRTFGIALGAAGAIIMIVSSQVGTHSTALHSTKFIGNILLLFSIMFSSINTVYVKGLFKKYSPLTVVGWASAIGALIIVPIFAGDFLKSNFSQWNTEMYGSLAYTLILGTAVATSLIFYGLKGVSATSSSIYVYIQPIVATTLATLRGQDKLTITIIASAALIFTGVFLVILSYNKSNKEIIKNHNPH